MVFEVDYDDIELQNIVMTSFQRRHHCVTEKRHQDNVTNFFQFGPPPFKICGCASACVCVCIPFV